MTYSLGPSCIDMMKAPSAQNTSLLPPPLATSPSSALSPFTWQRSTRYQSAIFVFAYKHSRDISLPTKVCIVKAMVFPVITHVCESWAIQKAECWRTDAFELWCWRFLRVPWTARRSNQSILKEINPKYSLEGLLLKLKLQYFGHLIRRADSLRKDPDENKKKKRPWCWKRLKAGGKGDDRVQDGWMTSPTRWTWVRANSGDEGQESLACCNPWFCKESDTTEQLNNNKHMVFCCLISLIRPPVPWKQEWNFGNSLASQMTPRFQARREDPCKIDTSNPWASTPLPSGVLSLPLAQGSLHTKEMEPHS